MPEITKKKKEEILLFQKKKRISKTPQNAILPYNAKSKKQKQKKSKSEKVKKTLNSTLTKQTCSFGFCLISGDSHWCSCLLGATGWLYWQRTHKEDSAKNKEKKPNESKSDIDLRKKRRRDLITDPSKADWDWSEQGVLTWSVWGQWVRPDKTNTKRRHTASGLSRDSFKSPHQFIYNCSVFTALPPVVGSWCSPTQPLPHICSLDKTSFSSLFFLTCRFFRDSMVVLWSRQLDPRLKGPLC